MIDTQQTRSPARNGRRPGLAPDRLQGVNGAAPDERAVTDADQSTRPQGRAGQPPAARHHESSLERFGKIVVATVIEGAAVYAWLRLHKEGHPWWGLASLAAGELVETFFLTAAIGKSGRKRWGELKPQERGHLRRLDRITGWAGTLEICIWELWLASFYWLDSVPRAQQTIAAGGVLLVLMHLKHQVETVTIRDTRFRTGLFSKGGTFASAMEVAGAVVCLLLIEDGHFVLAGAVLGAGLLIEHLTQIGNLRWEILARDIRLPRDPRWKPPSRQRAPLRYLTTHFALLWKLVTWIKPLARWFNRYAINGLILVVDPRPNPLSTMAPYTSWASLTDRTYSTRHLPPASSQASANTRKKPPESSEVARLFERGEQMIECPKSTVLFSFFAQWFTDGFLRTSREHGPDGRRNTLKNESTHEIDLSQLYGRTSAVTDKLRTKHDGLLISRTTDDGEYPEYLCSNGKTKPQFELLPKPVGFERLTAGEKDRLFAIGTDIANIGGVAFNVLFLREHNRIARQLSAANPEWDDERLFQTARAVLTVVLLKIVVEEYIDHIAPYHFRFKLTPGSFPNERWYRPNWMAIEFNLLYRWHSLVPSTFRVKGAELRVKDMLWNTKPLTDVGLGRFLAAASNQPAGRVGLFNTDEHLVAHADRPSILQGRAADLCSYNDYRRLCGYPPAAHFDEISSDPAIQERLEEVYGSVDNVEFYVGLFAEDHEPNDVLPPLMATMVAYDAFSQALTNPLLAPRIYNEDTFSPAGWKIINETTRLSDLVNREVPSGAEYFVSLTRRDYKRM